METAADTNKSVENYFDELDGKVVRIKLNLDGGRKIPVSCPWFDNRVPSYSNTNKPNSLCVFKEDTYSKYKSTKQEIDIYNALAIDTTNVHQIDFDDMSDETTVEELIKLGIPFFRSYSKGFHHFVFKDPNLTKYKNELNRKNFDFKSKYFQPKEGVTKSGEILCGQWSFARPDAKMENVQKFIEKGDFVNFDIMKSDLIEIIQPQTSKTNSKTKTQKARSGVVLTLDMKAPEKNEEPEKTEQPISALEEFSQCIDVERHIKRKGCYNDWKLIVWSLASVNEYELAKKISMKGGDIFDSDMFHKIYNSYDESKNITVSTFYNYCKKGNRDLFYELQNKHKKKVHLSSALSHDDKARLIFEHCGDYFVYIDDLVHIWSDEHLKWFIDEKMLMTRKFITDILRKWGEDELLTMPKIDAQGELNKKHLEMQKLINVNKQLPEVKNIAETFKQYLCCRNDNMLFDDQPYLLAFNNTVYDFKNKIFRDQQKEDHITMNTGYDWKMPTNEQMSEIKTIVSNIFTNKEVEKSYMSILYNGCLGISPEKFVIANGSGRNGKGLLNDLHRCALGGYAYELNSNTLCDKFKEGANPAVANLHKKRFVTSAEPDNTSQLNTDTIKKLTGGGELNARQLYSGKTQTILDLVLVLEANDMPTLSGNESDSAAMKQRLMDILFESRFTDAEDEIDNLTVFKQNPYYKQNEFKTSHRCALLKFIMDYEGIETIYAPDCVKERSKAYLLGNDKIYEFISRVTERAEGEWVTISDLHNLFKCDDSYVNMNKSDKRKFKLSYFKEQIQKHSQFKPYYKPQHNHDGTCTRNILLGFRIKTNDDTDGACFL